jgi:hypothetical protein
MCGLQHAALRHAALHVSGQHMVWQRMDISTERIRRMRSGVKSGFAMLQIEILNRAPLSSGSSRASFIWTVRASS